MFDVVYAEDNPLWILVGLLIMVALLVIVAILGIAYLAGLFVARRIERWVEERQRREIQSRAPLR
jgi:hypothetical protein